MILSTQPTFAQIAPDNTLGRESSVVTPTVIKDIPSDQIDGGAIRGANLFHSFQEFNVGEGRGVYFSNPTGIERILTRVTGGNRSQILGRLGVLGNADLFLINPNGIIFGPNARLDLNGSFIGTTASSIRFADGIEFSATNPQAPPLLTINVPLGLQFGSNPGRIVNQSADGTIFPTLQVSLGRTFALVGGDVALEGGTMGASEGRIELGSVGDNSFVGLTPIAQGWAFNYDGVQNFRDITLSQSAIVDTSGDRGGDIQVQARRLTMTEGAVLYYFHTGEELGGNIDITASESVELVGGVNQPFGEGIYTEISAFSLGPATGTVGNLTIKTRRLTIRDGAFVANQANGNGNGGNLTVLASDSIELIGTVPNNSAVPSGIFAQAVPGSLDEPIPIGNGGNLTIETGRLIIRDGGLISTNTVTKGRAGNLTVRASESIELIGTTPDPQYSGGIAAGVDEDLLTGYRAEGDGGNLTVETRRLTIQGGGQIATSTKGPGKGGDLIINASDSIELIGARPEANPIFGSSGLFASAELGSTGKPGNLRITTGNLIVRDGARISADNFGSSQEKGDLTINARQLSILNGGTVRAGTFSDGSGGLLTVNASNVEVSGSGTLGGENINSSLLVSSTGTGAAGTLDIYANSVQLDNSGRLAADSKAGLGNINIQARDLLALRRNSQISTNSTGSDPGGNINITTDNLVALENSDITANASNSRGGQVIINTSGIFGIQFQEQLTPNSDITATGESRELSGVVEINTPDVDPSSGLINLPTTVVDAAGLVARNVCTPQQVAGSSFVVTGRGGLPPSPADPFTNEAVTVEWARGGQANNARTQANSNHSKPPIANNQIVEAQGWIVGADGKIILTAEAPTATPYTSSLTYPNCRISPMQR